MSRKARRLELPLCGPRLALRELTPDDETDLLALYCDERITRHLLYGPRDAESARRHLARCLRRQHEAERDTWELAVAAVPGGALIGAGDLSMVSGNEAEIGYVLARAHWGKGLGQEVARSLLQLAFSGLAVTSVRATVEIHNERSIKVLERAGLRWEATLRRHAKAGRRWWDVHLYTLSQEDWRVATGTAIPAG